jgi:hypothetical protein
MQLFSKVDRGNKKFVQIKTNKYLMGHPVSTPWEEELFI